MTTEDLAHHWSFAPGLTFLNHGSFGACPSVVLDRQTEFRRALERNPMAYFLRHYEGLLDEARTEAARFVGVDPDDFVFVPNTTTGLNAVLRSLSWAPGDELLVTDHEYNASRNVLDFVAEQCGARVVVAAVPFPIASADQVLDAVLAAVTPRTRLLLIDHVTSQTAMVFPVARLAQEMAVRGVEVLVDGAHAPGMVPLDVASLGVAYYIGNFHKWVCAPKGAAFLFVRYDRQRQIRPAVISHGANATRTDRSRFQLEFAWTGTSDPTPYLCVPEAIRFLGGLLPGGWPALRERQHALVLAGRDVLAQALGTELPCPDDLVGTMATVLLPGRTDPLAASLYETLSTRYQIEIQVPFRWPNPTVDVLRVSSHAYNRISDYERLASVLRGLLPAFHLGKLRNVPKRGDDSHPRISAAARRWMCGAAHSNLPLKRSAYRGKGFGGQMRFKIITKVLVRWGSLSLLLSACVEPSPTRDAATDAHEIVGLSACSSHGDPLKQRNAFYFSEIAEIGSTQSSASKPQVRFLDSEKYVVSKLAERYRNVYLIFVVRSFVFTRANRRFFGTSEQTYYPYAKEKEYLRSYFQANYRAKTDVANEDYVPNVHMVFVPEEDPARRYVEDPILPPIVSYNGQTGSMSTILPDHTISDSDWYVPPVGSVFSLRASVNPEYDTLARALTAPDEPTPGRWVCPHQPGSKFEDQPLFLNNHGWFFSDLSRFLGVNSAAYVIDTAENIALMQKNLSLPFNSDVHLRMAVVKEWQPRNIEKKAFPFTFRTFPFFAILPAQTSTPVELLPFQIQGSMVVRENELVTASGTRPIQVACLEPKINGALPGTMSQCDGNSRIAQ